MGVSNTPLPAVAWLTTESPGVGPWPLMVRNMLDVDPRSITPLVRVTVPAGRSISMGLPLLEVMALAAFTASRKVAHDVPEQAAGDASSPVVVSVSVVIEA